MALTSLSKNKNIIDYLKTERTWVRCNEDILISMSTDTYSGAFQNGMTIEEYIDPYVPIKYQDVEVVILNPKLTQKLENNLDIDEKLIYFSDKYKYRFRSQKQKKVYRKNKPKRIKTNKKVSKYFSINHTLHENYVDDVDDVDDDEGLLFNKSIAVLA